MSLNILKAMALLRYNPKNSMIHKLVEAVCEDITALEINGLVDFLQARLIHWPIVLFIFSRGLLGCELGVHLNKSN